MSGEGACAMFAGQSVQDLNRLLKQHRMLAKTMKQMGRGGLAGMQRMLGGAARTMQARGPGPRRRFPTRRRSARRSSTGSISSSTRARAASSRAR